MKEKKLQFDGNVLRSAGNAETAKHDEYQGEFKLVDGWQRLVTRMFR